eukprot:Rhum_TRINITY_DN15056_c10_g1::Rhum_TRINITY_DN15056_c10_g1_i1::g.135364::m.135364
MTDETGSRRRVHLLVAYDADTEGLGQWVGQSLVDGAQGFLQTGVDLGFDVAADIRHVPVATGEDYVPRCEEALCSTGAAAADAARTHLVVACFMEGTCGYGKDQFGLLKKWVQGKGDSVVLQAVNGKSGQHSYWTKRIPLATVQSNLVLTVARRINPALDPAIIEQYMTSSQGEDASGAGAGSSGSGDNAAAADAAPPAAAAASSASSAATHSAASTPASLHPAATPPMPPSAAAAPGGAGDGEPTASFDLHYGDLSTRLLPWSYAQYAELLTRPLPPSLTDDDEDGRGTAPAAGAAAECSLEADFLTLLRVVKAKMRGGATRELLITLGVREGHVVPAPGRDAGAAEGDDSDEDDSDSSSDSDGGGSDGGAAGAVGLMGGDGDGDDGEDAGADGLTPEAYEASLKVLKGLLCVRLGCGIRVVAKKVHPRTQRVVAEAMLRKDSEDGYVDMRVAVCGNVDSGKSTLVGVLTRGQYDDGRGAVRAKVFNHKHEQETGRTSSVSERHLGFDASGETVNYAELGISAAEAAHRVSTKEIAGRSAKVCTLYDLAGHERYLKTTVSGMTGSLPDYACIVISANNGIQRMTKEHLGLCLALKIPFFVVVTRMDSTPEPVIKATLDSINKLLKFPSVKKLPYVVSKAEDVLICAKNISADRIAPIFHVSNVTGRSLDRVVQFLNLAPVRKDWGALSALPKELVIDSTFFVLGVGTVVGGIITQGTFKVNDQVYLGPNGNGQYRTAVIKSIQLKGNDVHQVSAGHDAALALKKEKRNAIRKGNVLLEYVPKMLPAAYREFAADIVVLYHSTTIKSQYEPVIHCSNVRQSAKITLVGTDLLRTGDKSRVHFKFLYRPEYMKLGSKLVFREGRTKGLGTIVDLKDPATGKWLHSNGEYDDEAPPKPPAAAAAAAAAA